MSYQNNEEIRNELHQDVVDVFNGVYNTDSDTSQASLDLSDGDPKLTVIDGKLRMFYGSTFHYTLEEVGQLETDDKAFSEYGHIPLSDNVIKVYKELNKALHQRKFRLTGKYDCANKFIRQTLTHDQFRSLPKVEGDWPWPYYFKDSSPIKGSVTFDQNLPDTNSDEHRRVCIINVRTHGNLSNHLEDRTVVYLAGDHDNEEFEEIFRNSRADGAVGIDESRGKRSKFAFHGYHKRRARHKSRKAVISSPFPKTFGDELDCELHIAVAKTRKGYFYYWMTKSEPSANVELEQLPLTEIPPAYTGNFEECEKWGAASLDQDLERLTEIFEGAWVLRGNRLLGQVNEESYPSGVLERLRCGFFSVPYPYIVSRLTRVDAVLKRAVGSIQRHGGAMFGFEETREKKVPCTIEQISEFVQIPTEELLAYIAHCMSSGRFFCGSVSFMIYEDLGGIFEVTSPVPVGEWMTGRLTDTGAGLLFVSDMERYLSVDTRDGVSWLKKYDGAGISRPVALKLAPLLASAESE